MIRLKTLLNEAPATKTQIKPITGILRGGLNGVVAFFKKQGGVAPTINIPAAQQKYGYDESKIESTVLGRNYLAIDNVNNSFISISSVTDTQQDIPTFKRITCMIIFKGLNNIEYTYFLCKYTKDGNVDSIGDWKQGNSIIQSINTFESKGGTLSKPIDFLESVQQTFPADWLLIQKDLSNIAGL